VYDRGCTLFNDGRDAVLVAPDGTRRHARVRARPGPGGRLVAALEGVGDRTAAEALRGFEVHVPASALPPLEEGTWYHRDLLGLPVRTDTGRELGRLVEICTGDQDVWVAEREGRTWFLPARKDVVLSVDTEVGVVVCDAAVDRHAL
jgi:16S rRNA processing protein RimM